MAMIWSCSISMCIRMRRYRARSDILINHSGGCDSRFAVATMRRLSLSSGKQSECHIGRWQHADIASFRHRVGDTDADVGDVLRAEPVGSTSLIDRAHAAMLGKTRRCPDLRLPGLVAVVNCPGG